MTLPLKKFLDTPLGGVTNNKLLPLFRLQKKCLRILFGDKEAYLDKFKTSARVRLFEEQKLGVEFFKREHSKPLFTKHSVMNVRNLFVYHRFNEIFKILKFRTPISLFEIFELSKRNDRETRLITPEPSLNCFSLMTSPKAHQKQLLKINYFLKETLLNGSSAPGTHFSIS